MKETYAQDLNGVNVRIISHASSAWHMQFVRLDTHEPIENIVHAHFDFEPGNHVWCTITLLHLGEEGHLSYEGCTINNPGVDTQVTIHDAKEMYTETDRRILAAKNALLAWTALHRGKDIAHAAMQRLDEIIELL